MKTLLEVMNNLGGAVLIAIHLIFQPVLKRYYQCWGATADELKLALPGDERVPGSIVDQTLAITIKAATHDIWPWLAQIGQERGGLYSYELLENIAGCKMHNADRIVPDWELKVGDLVRFGPKGYPVQKVVAIERGQWLLLVGADLKTEQVAELTDPLPAQFVNSTLGFYLIEQPDGTTRLIYRSHLDYAPRSFANKLIWQVITDPLGFVMTRKMLLAIKRRVEAARDRATASNEMVSTQD